MKSIGLCGDHCEYCPRYIATQSADAGELKNVKELWVRLGLRDPDFPFADMVCRGCRPENDCAFQDLCACVREQKVENCGACSSYPCHIIRAVFRKSDKLKSRARLVCSKAEMDILDKAFFTKKEYFDEVHHQTTGG